MTPKEVKESFDCLRQLTVEMGQPVIDLLERRLVFLESMWQMQERIEALAGNDDHSRKVPTLPDVDGYSLGSAKGELLRLIDSGERR